MHSRNKTTPEKQYFCSWAREVHTPASTDEGGVQGCGTHCNSKILNIDIEAMLMIYPFTINHKTHSFKKLLLKATAATTTWAFYFFFFYRLLTWASYSNFASTWLTLKQAKWHQKEKLWKGKLTTYMWNLDISIDYNMDIYLYAFNFTLQMVVLTRIHCFTANLDSGNNLYCNSKSLLTLWISSGGSSNEVLSNTAFQKYLKACI